MRPVHINSDHSSKKYLENKHILQSLHTSLSALRRTPWKAVYETMMKKHVELCDDIQDHLFTRDGLHIYRSICLPAEPNTFKATILFLFDLAEDKVIRTAQNIQINIVDTDPLLITSDQYLLRHLDHELPGTSERAFLWEAYRAVIEILHKTGKFDTLLRSACERVIRCYNL